MFEFNFSTKKPQNAGNPCEVLHFLLKKKNNNIISFFFEKRPEEWSLNSGNSLTRSKLQVFRVISDKTFNLKTQKIRICTFH